MRWFSVNFGSSVFFVISGIIGAVSVSALVTMYFPDENRVIPAPGVGQPAIPFVSDRTRDPRMLERGRIYYAQICMPCHGVRGDGFGEWAYRVAPKPADLRSARVRQRSDQEIFEIISDGLVGTAMIGWKRQLTEPQRWQIIAYLRTLSVAQSGLVNER